MEHAAEQLSRVEEIIKRNDIQFIDLQFTDIVGTVKSVGIPLPMWSGVVEHGMWFDGSSIQGFARIAESDMRLWPDLETFAVLPWEEDVPTARVICDVYLPDGEPFTGDPRYVLKKTLAEAEAMGYSYSVGPELEFFLFRQHQDGSLLPLEPHDFAGYFDATTDLARPVRRQMVKALQALGISVEALHHEVAIGQHEINFRYDDALRAADNAVTLRQALKAIAQRHGLHATFMPKPIAGINGSGMHTHQSLWKDGKNVFADEDDEYGLSETAKNFIAGQLDHARGLSLLIAPLVNSYKRLVPGYEAPVYLSWARINRSALIRIPKVNPGRISTATRIELRCPDPSANPYLAFAGMLASGLDGINRQMPAPEAQEEDLYHLEAQAQARLTAMPGSLGEAIAAFKEDALFQSVLGEHLTEQYVQAKTKEWDEYRLVVTQWELERYLATY